MWANAFGFSWPLRMAGNLDLLSAEEKKQFPHLVF
jgi:hypothetical protein